MELVSLKRIIKCADHTSSRLLLKMGVESNSLIILYLHGVFANKIQMETARNITMAYDGITLDGLRNVVKYFIASEYTFISPEDMLIGLAKNKKYVMLTFDDGYASNRMVLQVLKEFKVPAVFFISPRNILNNKCFWWDVVYRELYKRSFPLSKIQSEIQRLKQLKAGEIDEEINLNFGPDAFKPIDDLDRPMTVNELGEFSREPYVFIGNHTMDHAILTNYSVGEISSQILMAQDILDDIVNGNLRIISYPSGAYSPDVLNTCREMKYLLGFTIEPEKVVVPLSNHGDTFLSLGRYSLKSNDETVLSKCDMARSDFLWSSFLKKVYRHVCSDSITQ
jgi:peptidoglycan/xylan/chitin deacetylase (PgdA/CDA1 family)